MRVFYCTVYFNETSRFERYTEGDTLVASELPEPITVMCEDEEQAAREVFAALNADDRENGSYERSLSVGDVVAIIPDDDPTADVVRLAVEPIGWRRV